VIRRSVEPVVAVRRCASIPDASATSPAIATSQPPILVDDVNMRGYYHYPDAHMVTAIQPNLTGAKFDHRSARIGQSFIK
jgi:hypothetical protein